METTVLYIGWATVIGALLFACCWVWYYALFWLFNAIKNTAAMGKFIRMHAISIFDDVLGQSGPKKRQLQRSMDAIGARGAGLIVLIMPDRPEQLQAEIGRHPHPPSELRDYGIGAQILVDRGVSEMVLLSDSDRTVVGLEGYGLRVAGREPIPE